MVKRRRAARVWDVCAATLTSACLLHCLALPLLASLAPVATQLVDNHLLHVVLVMLAVPITLWVVWGEGVSGDGLFFTPVALAGLTLMIAAVTVLEPYEVPLTVIGGTMLGGAHLWRWFRHHAPVESRMIEDDA